MIGKIEIEDKRISRVSYLPAYIPEDMAPYVVKQGDPLFDTINAYMEKINGIEKIPTKYAVDGDEVVIVTGEA